MGGREGGGVAGEGRRLLVLADNAACLPARRGHRAVIEEVKGEVGRRQQWAPAFSQLLHLWERLTVKNNAYENEASGRARGRWRRRLGDPWLSPFMERMLGEEWKTGGYQHGHRIASARTRTCRTDSYLLVTKFLFLLCCE